MNLRKKQILTTTSAIAVLILLLVMAELSRISGLLQSYELLSSFQLALGGLTITVVLLGIVIFLIYSVKVDKKTRGWVVTEDSVDQEEQKEEEDEEQKEEQQHIIITIDDLKESEVSVTIEDFSTKLLSQLSHKLEIGIGVLFLKGEDGLFNFTGAYGYYSDQKPNPFKEGEGINGQVVRSRKAVLITNLPDEYLTIISGLGQSKPKYLLIAPIMTGDDVIGIIELASFSELNIDIDDFSVLISDFVSGKLNQLSKSK